MVIEIKELDHGTGYDLARNGEEKCIYILTHAGIWTDNLKDWLRNIARAIALRSVEKTVRWIKRKWGERYG